MLSSFVKNDEAKIKFFVLIKMTTKKSSLSSFHQSDLICFNCIKAIKANQIALMRFEAKKNGFKHYKTVE